MLTIKQQQRYHYNPLDELSLVSKIGGALPFAQRWWPIGLEAVVAGSKHKQTVGLPHKETE